MNRQIKVENTIGATRMGSNLNLHLLGQFCEDNELWINYQERLEEFITLNDVAENFNVSVLIACIGPKCYGLLKDLIAPAKPKSKTHKDLNKVLSDHFYPPPPLVLSHLRKGTNLKREISCRERRLMTT